MVMLVYTVWYVDENGEHRLWSIKASADSAKREVETILRDNYSTKVWYNTEEVAD